MFGRKFTIEKINMEELRPPYLLLSNHMYFIDFKICAVATWPHRVNNVVSIDGYHRRPFLMEWIGAICTRKFTADIYLVKSISKVLKRGDILCMYPEARYTPCDTTAYLPESLGKLIKLNKVPVVTMIHHGNHLDFPFWNWRKKRKVPLHAVMTQILTADQVKEQIDRGEYAFVDDVDVYSLPNCWKFEHLGPAKLTHDPENGFVLDGVYRGEKYHVQRKPLENNSLHVEYDYCYIKPEDCFDLSIENDSFYCYPKQQNVITKLAFATEEIYQRALAKKRQRVAP